MNMTLKKIEDVFQMTMLGSTWKTEVLAGTSTFLALSYIFVVNPAILGAAGMNKSAVFFATVIGSVITTLLMGLWANKPFAVAPGLEMNAYVAFVVIGALGFTWQAALGAVFWSGVLTILLSLTNLRVRVVEAIPDKLKSGLAASVGVFLLLIALRVSGLLNYEGIHLSSVGSPLTREAAVFIVGLALVTILRIAKIRGAVLLSIIGSSGLAHLLGIGQVLEPISFSKEMFSSLFQLDFWVILNPHVWTVILILFILDFYGSIAKFIGLTRNTNIVDKDGNLPKLKEALIVDGVGTVIGATTGTSNLITYVEGAVGIGEGGRTGLTAVVCAILMGLFLVITPVINFIPVVATTGALFFVGLSIFPNRKDLQSYSRADICSALIMILVTVLTFGLDKAMFAGFATYVLIFIAKRQWKNLNVHLVISTSLLLIGIMLSK